MLANFYGKEWMKMRSSNKFKNDFIVWLRNF